MVRYLYSVVAGRKDETISEDHIHLNDAGIEAVAEKTAEVLRNVLMLKE